MDQKLPTFKAVPAVCNENMSRDRVLEWAKSHLEIPMTVQTHENWKYVIDMLSENLLRTAPENTGEVEEALENLILEVRSAQSWDCGCSYGRDVIDFGNLEQRVKEAEKVLTTQKGTPHPKDDE